MWLMDVHSPALPNQVLATADSAANATTANVAKNLMTMIDI